jgi:hypothetical protein
MAKLTVKLLSATPQVEALEAFKAAAAKHFGAEGDGVIHLCGLKLAKEDGIFKTFILEAELRPA